MAKSEYRYTPLCYLDPWEEHPHSKVYKRSKIKVEIKEILEDLESAIVSDLYENFWDHPSDEDLREWGVID